MPRKIRLIESPRGGAIQTGQHSHIQFMAGSMGASPLPGNDAPLTNERFEAPIQDDAAWEQQVRERELAEGMEAANFTPQSPPPERFDGFQIVTRTPSPARPPWSDPPTPPDISGLPTTFALDVEQKPDGTWKVTAPGVHVGLFVADRDLGAALSRAPGVLAEIVRLDGVVAKPRARRGKA